MYGLINKAVEGLVRTRFGDAAWDRIRTRAGLPNEPFISMEQYPDKTTYDLVGAASAELGAPAEKVLEEFGEFWTVYAAEGAYGDLMNHVGATLPEFLRNLDTMHARIKLTFPELVPPGFRVTQETSNSLVLLYFSKRAGLSPLVIGMMRGLGRRFGVAVQVQSVGAGDSGATDVFHVSWS